MKKKTIIFVAIIVTAIISILIWSVSMPSRLVYFGGSSSVNPFMQIATKKFDENHKDYEVIYNSNGSQNGVRSVENGTYSVGMISKEIKKDTLSDGGVFSDFSEVGTDLTEEKNINAFSKAVKTNNDINAIEFAIDAIVIMYNPPNWVEEYSNLIDFNFEKNSPDLDIVKKVFSVAGYRWIDFLNDVVKDESIKQEINLKAKLQINGGNEVMMPISRESGSGTRSSFDSLFGITDINSGTANSNGSMITQLRDTSGSFGYVSYGFYKNSENNSLKTPWMNGFKLGHEGKVLSKDESITPEWSSNEDFIKSDDYLLKRPFIMLFDSNNKKRDVVLEFIEFMIKISGEPKSAFTAEGLVPKIEYLANGGIKNL